MVISDLISDFELLSIKFEIRIFEDDSFEEISDFTHTSLLSFDILIIFNSRKVIKI